MTVNERVKVVRETKGYTLKEFGSRIGISDSAVSQIEKGRNRVSEQVILLICHEFSIRERWLRFGEGDMFCLEKDQLAQRFSGGLTEEFLVMMQIFNEMSAEERAIILRFFERVQDRLRSK